MSRSTATVAATRMPHFSQPLHGLRGVAVLIVLLSHLGNADMPVMPLAHHAIGKAGVWIFFALSAFLLTRGLCTALTHARSTGQALMSYTVQRVFRIYPLYLVVLLLHGLVGNLSAAGVFEHLGLQAGRHELWAIPVEFKYYLVIPPVVLAARFLSRTWVTRALCALIACSFGAGLAQPDSVFSIELALLPKAIPFLAGSLLALHGFADAPPVHTHAAPPDTTPAGTAASGHRADSGQVPARAGTHGMSGAAHAAVMRRRIRAERMRSPWVQAGLWTLLLVATLMYRETTTRDLDIIIAAPLSLMLAAASAGLIHACLHPTWTARLLRTRPLVFMGEISFSLYLLHMFFIHAVAHLAPFLTPGQKGWLVLAVCIPVSVASYRLIEQPGIRAGKALGTCLSQAARKAIDRLDDARLRTRRHAPPPAAGHPPSAYRHRWQ
ncbi:MAG: acyltransferase [Lautropia sp.]|nr:acyltransferase [Lautropia sp.]